MPLPSTGPIGLSDVNAEMGRSSSAQLSLADAAVRYMLNVPTGAIGLNSAHGKHFFCRPSSYTHGGGAPGSQVNPQYAYDGNTGDNLELTTAAVITHPGSGSPDYSWVTYSGFGTGTMPMHIYMEVEGTLWDSAMTLSSFGVDVNGVTAVQVNSPGDGSTFNMTKFLNDWALGSVNLATLAITFWAYGGHTPPSGSGDSFYAQLLIYDLILDRY